MENVNGIFFEFASKFVGAEQEPTGDLQSPELLDRSKLDYSLASLQVVDAYLVKLHERRDTIGGAALSKTVIWGGAYVGEVIRRKAEVRFSWVDYDTYVAQYPDVVQYVGPREPPTYAFLCKPNGAMNLPLSKVLKCIINGIEDSVHFHAQAELAGQHR